MTELIRENVGESLVRVHQIITRALNVAAERSAAYARTGFPSVIVEAGFALYLQSLVAVLEGHHLSEDALAFPFIRDRLPDAPYDRFHEEHGVISRIAADLRAATREILADGRGLDRVHDALVRILEVWGPHIEAEERHLSLDALARVFEPDEHERLERMLSEFCQQHAGPDYLVVPFMLYNLPPSEREALARRLPPIIIDHLVPVAWAEQWAPMKPFLLG
jgi:hemerythrin-like domain-containing protein